MAAEQVIERSDLEQLFEALVRRGYAIVGPVARDGAIVYDEIRNSEQLPAGWTDDQQPGSYRLQRRDDQALFGYGVGPHSLKRHLLPMQQLLWRARLRDDGELTDLEGPPEVPKIAFLGARSCDLHGRRVLEHVLLGAASVDPGDTARSQRLFVIAVQCGQAGANCFCASMGTGPAVTGGYDIVLTEVLDRERHYFVAAAGTRQGADVLCDVTSVPAGEVELAAAAAVPARAAAQITRSLDTDGIKELLYRNIEHPRWDEVAQRCLACANCTMVCPTCFCTTIEDTTDLTVTVVERHQRWDSCFTVDYSYMNAAAVRPSVRSRYRQWMTHKLSTWFDQFGSSGCVGCGRCITWCPVGIDITEETAAIRQSEKESHASA